MLNEILEQSQSFSFSSDTILRITNNRCTILLYEQLAKYRSILDVLKVNKPIVLLYQTHSADNGHWTCITLTDGIINYFDSYGEVPDFYKNVTTDKKYLTFLLKESGYPISINKHDLQELKKNINTCGRFAALRAVFCNLNNNEFAYLLKAPITLKDSDDIACIMTLISY